MEHWENIIQLEIEFLHKFNGFKQDIEDLLKENEFNIQVPIMRFEDGDVFYGCPTPEQQAIYRMEREESLKKALIRGHERVNRLRRALERMEGVEGDILYYLEIEPGYRTPAQLIDIYGLKSMKELMDSRQKGLREVYEIFRDERIEQQKEMRKMLLEERKERVSGN